MAEITKDSTLREVLKDYAKRNNRDNTFISQGVKLFKDIADKKGSALKIFMPDKDGKTLLAKRIASVPEGTALKQPMQNLRQVGLSLKSVIPSTDKLYELLPDKETSSSKNLKIFGVEEPAKAKALVSVNPNPKVLQNLFSQIAEFKKDPALEAVADAALFNIQNGLRPNAAAGLQVGDYFPESGSLYIPSEAKGAKGKSVSIPLSALADSILQDRIKNNKIKEIDGIKHFFVKPNGKVVSSTDMTALLKRVKVPNILYDQKTRKYFNTLAPLDKDAPGKTGSSLFRNIHAKLGQIAGIPDTQVAYLEGRSLSGVAKGATGELVSYQTDFPGAIDPKGIDAQNANKISTTFAPVAKKYGYDISGKVSRITSQTEGYTNYFDAPIEKKAPVTPSPTVQGEPSKGLMDKLAKFGITIGKKLPIVAAGIVYAEQKEAGASTGEALGYAGSEFLPISASDADMAGAFVKKVRDEGLPEAIGLDTEKQKQMNITRKQRLADRVKRNTSVTPPPEEGFINQNQMGE
jgi:integrase